MKKIMLLLAVVLLAGCGAGKKKEAVELPSWVDEVPQEEGMVYVVGVSNTNSSITNALAMAKMNALSQLQVYLGDNGYKNDVITGTVIEETFSMEVSEGYIVYALMQFDLKNAESK